MILDIMMGSLSSFTFDSDSITMDTDHPPTDGPPTLTVTVPQWSLCAWAVCCVGGIERGCLIPEAIPIDICSAFGCDVCFHHCCQTEWEMSQYKNDYPDGDAGECKYESSSKLCISHHLRNRWCHCRWEEDDCSITEEERNDWFCCEANTVKCCFNQRRQYSAHPGRTRQLMPSNHFWRQIIFLSQRQCASIWN